MKIIYQQLKILSNKFKRFDQTMLFILLVLAAINILIQYSANDKIITKFISDIIYLGLGFALLFIIANLSISQLKHVAIPFYVISILLLLAVFVFGVKTHGAKRWLNLGIRIQPSELCKLSVPLLLAYHFSLKTTIAKFSDYLWAILIIAIPFTLIVKQPDLGTATLVASSGLFVIFFAGLSWRIIITSVVLFLASMPIIWLCLHDYQKHRLLILLNPQTDPLGSGYHIIQGMIAIGSGGLYGNGYLQGTQSHLAFIPEKHTDFVISVIAEEFGYIGVAILLLLYLGIILRGIKIMQHSDDRFTALLAGSITLSMLMYVLINMGMVAGIVPVVGVPLPLISYGGTSTLVLMIGFGLLMAIAKHNHQL